MRVPLNSNDKNAAITELLDVLDDNGLLEDRAVVSDAVFTREQTRSTGIGSGIAIPHGKCDAVKNLVMAIGIAHTPIDFESIDGRPVTTIILLISPTDQTGAHIQALAGISRLMLDEQFKQAFEQSENSDQAYNLLRDKEKS
ncbi:MAG: PTS sugar transporter subunit IIA [Planctomycetes bacterium]|nr:PTS sugar transporter subunit IIA [Planctomycetota bacterium]